MIDPPNTTAIPAGAQDENGAAGEVTAAHTPTAKKKRGFAAMDRALVSAIASKGGKAAHAAGTAHEFNAEEARVAGTKGGKASHAARRKAQG